MAEQTSSVVKAEIMKEDGSGKVTCQFNPQDFSITRKIVWEGKVNIGGDASKLTFSGGEAQDLTIPLLFDSTESGGDVRDSYKPLLDLACIDDSTKNQKTQKGEPPRCRFVWGGFLSFTAVITQITQKFLMFKSDGTPVRAEVSVTFKQLEEEVRAQNPTSRSEARKIWVVHEGDRLDLIAHKEYGNAAHWKHIAETNDLADPFRLQPGQILKITPLP
ncbi:MAG: peptidoglycan-binding protein [Anaerolineae bacterium]|nr:peptidoglycan-binding protein [Anaerolineae bacterium]